MPGCFPPGIRLQSPRSTSFPVKAHGRESTSEGLPAKGEHRARWVDSAGMWSLAPKMEGLSRRTFYLKTQRAPACTGVSSAPGGVAPRWGGPLRRRESRGLSGRRRATVTFEGLLPSGHEAGPQNVSIGNHSSRKRFHALCASLHFPNMKSQKQRRHFRFCLPWAALTCSCRLPALL